MLKELFLGLKAHGLIFSVTVGATPYQATLSYDILSIAKCVDFINLMTFNFNGHWNGRTGFNSALYSYDDNNVEKCVSYWLNGGAPAEKLNLGIPFFGRSFKLADKNKTELGAKTVGPGGPGVFSKEAGYLGYVEVRRIFSSVSSQLDTISFRFAWKISPVIMMRINIQCMQYLALNGWAMKIKKLFTTRLNSSTLMV